MITDKVTDEALKRFAAGHIGGLNTEAMAKEILELRAENASLQNQLKRMRDMFNESSENEEIRLRAENARLREALQFYADKKHEDRVSEWDEETHCYRVQRYSLEHGEHAREALENVSKNEGRIGDDE